MNPESISLNQVARLPTENVRKLLEQHQDLLGGIGSLIENVDGLADVLTAQAAPFADCVAQAVIENEHDGGPAVEAWNELVQRTDWQQAIVSLGAMVAVSLLTSLRVTVVLAQREIGGGPVPADPPSRN